MLDIPLVIAIPVTIIDVGYLYWFAMGRGKLALSSSILIDGRWYERTGIKGRKVFSLSPEIHRQQ